MIFTAWHLRWTSLMLRKVRIGHASVATFLGFCVIQILAANAGARMTKPKAASQFTIFDSPGHGKTLPGAINSAGTVAGYADSFYAFVRKADGKFDKIRGGKKFDKREPVAINDNDEVVGRYDNEVGIQGFYYPLGGTMVRFRCSKEDDTEVRDINNNGEIVGYCSNKKFGIKGFLRTPDGAITQFGLSGDTYANAINDVGTVVGYIQPQSAAVRGFVRDSDGNVAKFDAPGATKGNPQYGTFALGINSAGTVVCTYTDSQLVWHGCTRSPDGTITEFDLPGQPQFAVPQTMKINSAGTIAGTYFGTDGLGHGFMRLADGALTTFDGPNSDGGTYAIDINDAGLITGYQCQELAGCDGFIFTP